MPQRLQTALGLYSNDLCGLVLLTDNNFGSYSGITKELVSISQLTTDFHFPPIDDQLAKIQEDVKEAVAWKVAHQKENSHVQVVYLERNYSMKNTTIRIFCLA